MNIQAFVAELQRLYATGQTTEHSFRPALAKLFEAIDPHVSCINEPQAITNVGRPDFVFTREAGKRTLITVGHCEAKDIGLDINPKAMRDANKDQHERYVKALPNLIYTNGLDFAFYKNGELVREIKIGELLKGIQPLPENFEALANQLRDFATERPQTISGAEPLAEMMASKATLIKDVLYNTLREDPDLTSELAGQYKAFQDQLIHDLQQADFADIYAETIAYGMFAARLHDETLEDFTREEALKLLPKSNPFLRKLFEFVAGPSLPDGIRKTVDELAEVFQATDLQKLFVDFGHFTQRNDPFIHFYETFLAKYNPAKRKSRGVWYTPEPVVNFIVRAVDDVLKNQFGLAQGLADTSRITVDWDTGQARLTKKGKAFKSGERQIEKKEVHRVQILDPAAGTGTFLAEVIRQIGERVQDVAPGQWSIYVENELIPRLHGFELLMASYAMCHMKLDMMLTAMGYKPTGSNPPRLSVYLTNSLEEGERANQTLPFAQWLSNEAKEANTVKNDVPVMCVIGNPPYSGISQNMGEWIVKLIEPYKYVDGEHFGERKHSLHDDYVKFIRFAEHMISRNGEGVLGFITNHGYLDNPTFRGMRWHLLQTFDEIQVLDLHGNTKRGETPPAGIIDKNVFDIQQGVSIVIASKRKAPRKHRLAKLYHAELWGSREEKYQKLFDNSLTDLEKKEVEPVEPYFTFNGKSGSNQIYESGFSIVDFFRKKTTGVQTSRDPVALAESADDLRKTIAEICNPDMPVEQIREKYFTQTSRKYPAGDTRDWKLEVQRKKIPAAAIDEYIVPYAFRPFDNRLIAFHPALVSWPRTDVSRHMLHDNISLITARSNKTGVNHFYCSRFISDVKCGEATTGSIFAPLYLYPEEQSFSQERSVNFDDVLWNKLQDLAEHPAHGRPNEITVFDYIYGVLHCPTYRKAFEEFLRIDFARIPWPQSPDQFYQVAEKGGQLRCLHLMERAAIGQTPYPFTGEGDSVVARVEYRTGSVFVNDAQSFENVPQSAWELYVGGYQPAQKWLRDRRGRTLSFDDIVHYQKIIKILAQTELIMDTIEIPL